MRGSLCWALRTIGLSAAALLCAAACGDADGVDFDSTDGGGSGGKQSSGGSSGKGSGGSSVGGSSGSGGAATGGASGSSATGGSGNVSGTAGSGGGSTGGAAGKNGTGGGPAGGAGGGAGSPGSGGSGGSTGGSAGSTGTGGAGGSSGVGGGPDAGGCPATQPGAGDDCEPDGLSCTYGDPCCPTTANCSAGHWIVLAPACVAPVCPDELPDHGKECDRCSVPPECRYDRCNGDAFYTARCNAGGNWVVTSTPCKFACGDGGLECQRDELCVKTDQGLGPTYSCESNPCGTEPVSCACAESLCPQPAVCSPNGTGGRDVACACLICV